MKAGDEGKEGGAKKSARFLPRAYLRSIRGQEHVKTLLIEPSLYT